MSFQPLDPNLVIDPFAVTSLTGPDAHTGIYLDADQTNSSVLIKTNDTPAMYIDMHHNMGINTTSPAAQLDINSADGSCIQLTYNNGQSKANIKLSSDGKLGLSSAGAEVNIDSASNFNIKSHNGLTAGLMLNNAIVRATADQLNYNVVMPGQAASSKALVLNSAGSISGINALGAVFLTGTLMTKEQPNIESVTTLDIKGHNGVSGLKLDGYLITATADKLNYIDTTPGMAQPTKALVVNGDRDIGNINTLTASDLWGTINTVAQPNITSVGTLQGLNLNGALTGLVDLSINTTETGRSLVVNSESGNCIRLFNNAAAEPTRFTDLIVDGSGNLSVTSSGGSVDITSHNGTNAGLKLGSVLVTATADQMNYLQGTVPGSAREGKAVILDANKNIANLNTLTATSYYGTILTPAQPMIASVSALNITTHDGSAVGLKLAGELVTSTAEQLNYVNTTKGTAVASKALVVDGAKDIKDIHELTAELLNGTLKTVAQPNITSVGILESIATSGDLTIKTTTLNEDELKVLDAVDPGTASGGKAVVLSEAKNITGISELFADELSGEIQTAAQPKITSVTTMNITGHNKSQGLTLGGMLVSSTAGQLNYVDIVSEGIAERSKALVLNNNYDITGIHSLSATNLSGTIQTPEQPTITSVGTLSSIATSGDFTIKATTLNEDQLKVLDGAVIGQVVPLKAVIADANKDISSFRNLTAATLAGEIQTAVQPKIASVKTLDITDHNGNNAGLKLGGILLTATADQINSIFGAGGTGTFTNLAVNNTLTVAADGESKGLILGTTLVKSSADELNFLDGSVQGTATEGKALVVSMGKTIDGINELTATLLNGTINTPAQPTITSVGTLTSIATSGNLTMGDVTISKDEIGVLDGVTVTPGTVLESKAVVVSADKDISSFRNLTAVNLIGTTLTGTLQTADQPSITSVGTLGSLAVTNGITLGGVTISPAEIGVIDGATPGTAVASKAMVLDANKSITGVSSLSSNAINLLPSSFTYLDSMLKVPGAGWPTNVSNTGGMMAYSPTLKKILVAHASDTGANGYALIDNPTVGYAGIYPFGENSTFGIAHVRGVVWNASKFYVYYATGTRGQTIRYITSTNGYTWTGQQSTNIYCDTCTSFEYHAGSGHTIMMTENRFYYSADGITFTTLTLPSANTLNISERYTLNNTLLIVGNYVSANNFMVINDGNTFGIVQWTGTTWVNTNATLPASSTIPTSMAYHPIEDRLYITSRPGSTSTTLTMKYIDSISTLAPTAWTAAIVTSSITTDPIGTMTIKYFPNYDIIAAGNLNTGGGILDQSTVRVVRIANKQATFSYSGGGATDPTNIYGYQAMATPILFDDILTLPALKGSVYAVGTPNGNKTPTVSILYSKPQGANTQMQFGSTTITEAKIRVIDEVTAGTVSASKAVIVDSNKDISSFRNLTATTLTGAIQTAAQPLITSVGTLSSIATSGDLTIKTTTLNEDELKVLDAVTAGTVSGSKAVVVSIDKDIGDFRNLTAATLTGAIQTAAQPLITSVGKLNSLAVAGDIVCDGDITVGGTLISETEIQYLDGVQEGTAARQKALVTDDENMIDGIAKLSATHLEGRILTASQPDITSVRVLDVTGHDGGDEGLMLGGVLLTATADQINSIFGAGGTGTFNDLAVNHNLTLPNADGSSQGLILGNTLVTATGTELNYVKTTPGKAQASKALVFDSDIKIEDIASLKATELYGLIKTEEQPFIKSVNVLNVALHNGNNAGLQLGGILLTATATQLNSIFNGGGTNGTFNKLTINDTLTIPNANGTMGLVLGETLLTATGTELNYLAGSTPGVATSGKALVVSSEFDIRDIRNLIATELTGTLKTVAQPNITSVGTLTSLSVSGDVTIGNITLNETEVQVLDGVFPGTVAGNKAVVVDEFKNISSFNDLTAVNLIGTTLTGTLETVAQPKITSVGTLSSLTVAGDVNVGGTLNVGGTIISKEEILALDEATPGTATANKAMVTNGANNIGGISELTASKLFATEVTGTLQTPAQPLITSVGQLTELGVTGDVDVTGDVNVGGSLVVGGTFISQSEIVALDAATPGTAVRLKAMITNGANEIHGIAVLSSGLINGTINTPAQPNINEVNILNVSTHDGQSKGLSLGGILITASATEVNYVDTSVGAAQPSKALVLNEFKNISGINNVSLVGLTAESTLITNTTESTLVSNGALVVAGGVGVGGSINVGASASVAGNVVVSGTSTLVDSVVVQKEDDTTSPSSGSFVTAGGVGIGKALEVGTNAKVGGNLLVSGTTSLTGVSTITNDTDSTTTTNGSLVTNGGVGIAKALTVGTNATVGGDLSVTGSTSQSGSSRILNSTESTSSTSGALVVDGGVGIAKALNVGGNTTLAIATDSVSTTSGALVVTGGVGIAKALNVGTTATVIGDVSIGGSTTQTGPVAMNNTTDSSSPSTGSLVVAGGVGIAKSLHVGSNVLISGTTTQTGVVTIDNTTDADNTNVGSLSTAGGATFAKSVIIGENATVKGDASIEGGLSISEGVVITGATSQSGLVSITNETESTSTSNGSLTTAGGVGIAKSLNVGGITKALNVAVSSSSSTGSLVVAGGAGVQGDINVGGNVGVAGNMSVSGNMDLDGNVVSSNFSLSSAAGTPFSSSIVTTIKNTNTILAMNLDAGVGYSKSDSVLVVVPSLVTKESVLYKSNNGGSSWTTLALTGDALGAFNDSYSEYLIKINQLVVNQTTDKIWLAGSFYDATSSIAVVLSGTVTGGISTLYTIGSVNSSAVDVACTEVAVASDSKVAVLVYKGVADGQTNIFYLNTEFSPSFNLNVSGSFDHLAWCAGLDKFVASRYNVSSVYVSTDDTATTWVDGTTPTDIGPISIHYNTTLDIAVAVGTKYIWHSTDGVVWTNATYTPLATGNTFNAVLNSPTSGLFAIYSNINNSTKQVYYSTDGLSWMTVAIPQTLGHAKPLTSNVAYDAANYAYSVSLYNSVNVVQKVGPLDFSSKVFSLDVTSDYVHNKTGSGYKWFSNSTPSSNGQELMQLTPTSLELNSLQEINNDTDSLNTATGSLTTAGGVGIAKSLNVGGDTNIGGNLSISGSFAQSGEVAITSSAESTSTSTGAIVTSGGVGIAKRLNVGGAAAVGGNMTISGDTAQFGVVTISNSTDSTSELTGALKIYGGVGIVKTLNVGEHANVTGNVAITGTTTQTGDVTINSIVDATSATSGSLKTSGGVGIAKSLYVGENVNVVGNVAITGTTSQTGDVSLLSLTDSSSSTTGALVVAGGVGVSKTLSVGGNANLAGNVSITGTTEQVGQVSISNITDATSASTGALVVAGGAGVSKSLFVGENANISGALSVSGLSNISNLTDALSATSGSFTTAGGAGIAKSLHVGSGIYGTIETTAQPKITSVKTLNIMDHDGSKGLSLGGELVTSSTVELNYLHGSTPGAATEGNALVLNMGKNISGIARLSATTLAGRIETADQPNIQSVTILDVTAHDGSTTGLKLGGVLLKATSIQLNSLVAGTSSPTFVNATVANNLTLSGANGTNAGLILGSTLVTSSGTQLNYVNILEAGKAEPNKALVLDFASNIQDINKVTANQFEGTILTPEQPNISSVNVLNITGHNGSSTGLKLNGVLVTATAAELNYLATTEGSAQLSKALVVDNNRNIANINELTASIFKGTIHTAAQPNITSVGTLNSVAVTGTITLGATIISETDIAKIDDITNGVASADKALVLDSNKSIGGISSLAADVLAVGSPSHSDLPLEVGTKSYIYGGAYAYSNSQNAHGLVDAGEGTMANYSLRTEGRILCQGEIQITSDKRLKTNVIELTPEFSKQFIMTTTPVKFNWTNQDQITDYGYLAQSVMKAGFTDLVTVVPHPGMEGSVDDDGFVNPPDAKFVFSPGKIIPLLALNQREVFNQLEEKDQKIQDLEERLAKLEELISKLA